MENHRHVESHRQTLPHKVHLPTEGNQTDNFNGDIT